jgi:hypothetical protein
VVFPGALNHFQAERPFWDSYAATDIRKAATWLTEYVQSDTVLRWTYTGATSAARNAMRDQYGSTGVTPRKYLDRTASDEGAEKPDYIVLRYADVLLSLAEALNEMAGSPPAEAYTLVQQVRTRAGVTAALPAGLTKQAFKDSLFVQRRFEFAMEGHGMFDSRRNWAWAKARVEANMANRTTLNASPFTSNAPKFDARPIPDKWKLFPIPNRACELNPLLTQNPGWEQGFCQATAPAP